MGFLEQAKTTFDSEIFKRYLGTSLESNLRLPFFAKRFQNVSSGKTVCLHAFEQIPLLTKKKQKNKKKPHHSNLFKNI